MPNCRTIVWYQAGVATQNLRRHFLCEIQALGGEVSATPGLIVKVAVILIVLRQVVAELIGLGGVGRSAVPHLLIIEQECLHKRVVSLTVCPHQAQFCIESPDGVFL